jgi:hypothetical protein
MLDTCLASLPELDGMQQVVNAAMDEDSKTTAH